MFFGFGSSPAWTISNKSKLNGHPPHFLVPILWVCEVMNAKIWIIRDKVVPAGLFGLVVIEEEKLLVVSGSRKRLLFNNGLLLREKGLVSRQSFFKILKHGFVLVVSDIRWGVRLVTAVLVSVIAFSFFLEVVFWKKPSQIWPWVLVFVVRSTS